MDGWRTTTLLARGSEILGQRYSPRGADIVMPTVRASRQFRFKQMAWAMVLAAAWTTAGCGLFGRETPTRTPVPTFTPTPLGVAAAATATNTPGLPVNLTPVVTLAPPTATETPTPLPPTDTPIPTPTPPATATATQTPTPSPTPSFVFDLELAEKHPTESLAPNIVRIFLYVYSDQVFALEGYTIQVTHNGVQLPVDQVSAGGLPDVTRTDPGPYSRFTNMNMIFVEAQAGSWVVQLVDADNLPVGPPATFELTGDEDTRELYVRYRQK